MTVAQSNIDLAERARAVIPGGVNSGNRALPWPLVVTQAYGAFFTDVDGQRYLDYHAAASPISRSSWPKRSCAMCHRPSACC